MIYTYPLLDELYMSQILLDPRTINANQFPFAGSCRDQLYFLLNYAVLAPSSHNSQPWAFRLNDTSVDIFLDLRRALSIVDPDNREIIISCGAAIGTLVLSAKFFGYQANVKFAPTTIHLGLLASISLTKSQQPTSADKAIFAAIKKRQTNRKPFDDIHISPQILNDCVEAAKFHGIEFVHFIDDKHKLFIAELAQLADRKQFSQPWFRSELASWMHSKYNHNKDGMSAHRFGIPDILTPLASFIVRTCNIGKKVARSNRAKIQSGSPALGVLASQSDSPHDWLNTGHALAHVLLILTRYGLTAAYINQVIEIPTLRRRLQKYSTALAYPQILLRAGQASSSLPKSVRRSVDDCLM
jgi:hypothetical protein